MDQRALYEQQSSALTSPEREVPLPLVLRDQFILRGIQRRLRDGRRNFAAAELSVGEGRLTLSMLRSFPELRLHGIDISHSRLECVRRLATAEGGDYSQRLTLTECNLDTDFEVVGADSYDVAVALDVMEHVLDVFGFVDHCHRILRRDGVLFLRVPNIGYIKHRWRLLFGELPVTASWFGPRGDLSAWKERHGWDGGHLHLFTVPILSRLLTKAGFELEECKDPGARFAAVRNRLPNLLYANPLMVAKKLK
jgi:cyclopropane fatty-acyl-phospholipid synthase-like methyltransferase